LSGGGLTLLFKIAKNPGTTWTGYKVALNELAGWRKGSLSGLPPTQAEMLSVLAGLTEVRIRGAYSALHATGGLDNVTLLAPLNSSAVILVLRRITGQQLMLEWPVTATGFRLQSARTLSSTGWADVSSTPAIINGLNTVLLPATDDGLFFRLNGQSP